MTRDQFSFFHPFRIRYSEIDGQGVVFNAHYLTFYDTTITEYFARSPTINTPTPRRPAWTSTS